LARISFLHRRDGRYYLQARMPVTTGGISGSRVFRSALGTSVFAVARRRISLCVAWILDIKDHPELIKRGALLLRQIRHHLDCGFPLDADVLAARLAFEYYVRTWLTECRGASFAPDEVCPGLTPAWKAFVEQNQTAEKAHLRKTTDDAYRRRRRKRRGPKSASWRPSPSPWTLGRSSINSSATTSRSKSAHSRSVDVRSDPHSRPTRHRPRSQIAALIKYLRG